MKNFALRPAFTLFEIALVIGILSVLLGFSLVIANSAVGRAGLRSAENIIVQGVRRAQTLSQNSVNGGQYGIFIQEGSVIIFYGPSFTSRDTSFDQVYDINDNISFSGTLYEKMSAGNAGLVFDKISGDPSPANFIGTIILTLGNESKTVTVNGKGVVER